MNCSIVVNCTNRKSLPSDPNLIFADYFKIEPDMQVNAWAHNIEVAVKTIPAYDLYQGNYWSEVRSLRRMLEFLDLGIEFNFYVASAGMGLISLEDTIPSYNATFSPNNPNSIGSRSRVVEWWSTINTIMNRTSLEKIFQSSDFTFLAVSQSYLFPMICGGIDLRATDGNVALFSRSKNIPASLSNNAIPFIADFENYLGGTRDVQVLRVLSKIFQNVVEPLNLEQVKEYLEYLFANEASKRNYNRSTVADSTIETWIKSQLSIDNKSSATSLLRRLRDSGFASEQTRFRKIYKSVISANNDDLRSN